MTDTFVKVLLHQYRDATNLNARVQLHERFSTNRYGWHRWVFDQLAIPPNGQVLEVGCGPGLLWQQNLGRIPHDWEITLGDLSPGMLDDARRNLANVGRSFQFRQVDAQQIPFPDASFDAVIANHMLYHVPDRDRALGKIRRVLRPDGRFYAATNGKKHLQGAWELMSRAGFNRFERPFLGDAFSLENGAEQIGRHFPRVDLRRYDDALVVTEVDPLIAYVVSGIAEPEREADKLERLAEILEEEIRCRGAVRIAKETGIFIARGDR
jgi:ubiquinone/menaquinone biosynthesis C-methylase UbiE